MKVSIIHPSRSRHEKSVSTIDKWLDCARNKNVQLQLIVSVDDSDPELYLYQQAYQKSLIVNNNRSCVDAINNAAKVANGDVFIVVSDDTDCFIDWDMFLLLELDGKSDYLLKCKDGIQDYIVTMTVCDREYFKRDNFIYHPEFDHQFADTYLTCLADIRGRLIKSNLEFRHRHYSYSGGNEMPDALHRRNDATWMTGQDTFVRLMKQFTPEERARIKDRSMQGFMKHVGL